MALYCFIFFIKSSETAVSVLPTSSSNFHSPFTVLPCAPWVGEKGYWRLEDSKGSSKEYPSATVSWASLVHNPRTRKTITLGGPPACLLPAPLGRGQFSSSQAQQREAQRRKGPFLFSSTPFFYYSNPHFSSQPWSLSKITEKGKPGAKRKDFAKIKHQSGQVERLAGNVNEAVLAERLVTFQVG